MERLTETIRKIQQKKTFVLMLTITACLRRRRQKNDKSFSMINEDVQLISDIYIWLNVIHKTSYNIFLSSY